MGKDTIVCRCEDLSLEEINSWIEKGYQTFDEIKRVSRVGMGPCQGKTCRAHILRLLAEASGTPLERMHPATFRPPVKPIRLGTIAGGDRDD